MILYTQNYERQILVNKQPFFKAKWPYSLHIFSLVSLVKKYATCKPIWPFKKAVYSHGSTIHSFFCPIIHFFNNECGKGTVINCFKRAFVLHEQLLPAFTERLGVLRHKKFRFATLFTFYLNFLKFSKKKLLPNR